MKTIPLALALIAALPARAEVVLIELEGMTCNHCESKVEEALDKLEFLTNVGASLPGKKACAELTGALDTPAITATIAELGYTVIAQDLLESCPDIADTGAPGNWGETSGVDARIISTGNEVDFEASLVPDKFTVFDFGANWCAPCHAAEKLLKAYMGDHPDVAVRAIVLEGKTPKNSFAHPVVHQHLSGAAGLPYFVVYSPEGKRIYRGVNLPKALKKIDKKR